MIHTAHAAWEKAHLARDTAFLDQFKTATDYAAYCAENYFKALLKNAALKNAREKN